MKLKPRKLKILRADKRTRLLKLILLILTQPHILLTTHQDPSSRKPLSPVKHSDKTPADDQIEEVTITVSSYQPPGVSIVLTKHSAKDDFVFMNKGKGKTDLSSYADLSAQDLHSGFLNRLFTSRDYEAGLVNLMKERYEVNTFILYSVPSLYCSPQGPVCLAKSNRDFYIPYCTLLIFLVYFLIKHTLAPKCHD